VYSSARSLNHLPHACVCLEAHALCFRTCQIFVKSDRTVVLDVEPSTCVEAVKTAAGVTGFRLVFAGRHLEDAQTLAQCGIKVRSLGASRVACRGLLDTRGFLGQVGRRSAWRRNGPVSG